MNQKAVMFDQENQVFHLRNNEISYIIQLEEDGILNHLYFGKAITRYNGIKDICEETADFLEMFRAMLKGLTQKTRCHRNILVMVQWIIVYRRH